MQQATLLSPLFRFFLAFVLSGPQFRVFCDYQLYRCASITTWREWLIVAFHWDISVDGGIFAAAEGLGRRQLRFK